MNIRVINNDYSIDLSSESDERCLCPYCDSESFFPFAEEIEKDIFINKCKACNNESINYKDKQYKIV